MSRDSSRTQATKVAQELSWLQALSVHVHQRCVFDCYQTAERSDYQGNVQRCEAGCDQRFDQRMAVWSTAQLTAIWVRVLKLE